jgi:hypothetical protein
VSLGLAIGQLAEAEERLVAEFERVRERHRADQDVYHLSATLAGISRAHLSALAPFAQRYGGEDVDANGSGPASGLLGTVREKASELTGRRPESGMLLLRDLRELYLLASDASLGWTVVGQGAQAVRDRELLDVVSECHRDTLRQLRWVTTRIKQAAPQALTT